MRERQEDFPCLICGRILYREMDDEGQPRDGVVCTTHGNYGSRVFDDLHGEYLAFNICDGCLKAKAAEQRIFITQGSIPVWAESNVGYGVCGAYPVDRPYVPWRPDMQPSNERFNVDMDEIIKQTYPKSIRWNGGDDWPDMLAASFMAERGDAEEYKQILPEYAERIDAMMAAYERYMEEHRARMRRS